MVDDERVVDPRQRIAKPVIGWREWVGLPDLGVPWVKAKIDTGARSSALHAFDLEHIERDGMPWLRFEVHPWQRCDDDPITAEAPLTGTRLVRSSNGSTEERPVIVTPVRLGEHQTNLELTLTRRDQMGFRLLIGRQALRGTVLIDPEQSFLCGRAPRPIRRANRRWKRP